MTGRRWRRWTLRAGLLALATAATTVGWNFATGNLATVAEGRAYRSAQLRAADLSRAVAERHVRTVLNLRGSNPDKPWYRAERAATLDAGATQVDMALSSCIWMSRTQLRTLVDVLATCEKPVLIHCERGAERTGLASALLTLLEVGSTLEEAKAQFSVRYLFVPLGDGVVMLRHLEQYESWLALEGLGHTPSALRRWVEEGFAPGSPGREEWAKGDPYPLVVITRPTPGGPVERKIWDESRRPEAAAGAPGLRR